MSRLRLIAALLLAACLGGCDAASSDPAAGARSTTAAFSVTLGKPTIQYGRYTSFPVLIRNASPRSAQIVTANCLFYDQAGQLLVSGDAYAMNLEPGAVGGDNIIVDSASVANANCRISDVTAD
jgi:hypothetical protein